MARRYVRRALILVVVLFLTVPAVLAKSAGGAGARASSAAAAQLAQGDPRDPFDRDDGGAGAGSAGADAEALAGTGATTSQSGVTSAGSLPLTGSTTTLLVGVAAGLLLAGGVALWTTRYRPRHAGYRPRHAR